MHPLVILTRSNHIESIHYGLISVIDEKKNTIFQLGDSSTKVFLRSAAKPFQALAAVYSGAMDYYKISEEELAVMCSSHSGQKIHRDAVSSILNKIGLDEDSLDCGIANPYNQETNKWLIQNGKRPSKIYNCCSGKHAAMLMACKFLGYPIENYVQKDHPLQQYIFSIIAELLDCPVEDIILGDDGCGVPNCMVTMQQAAYLYSLLAGSPNKSKYTGSFQKISQAMRKYPRMVNGDGEFCTDLIHFAKGRIIGKVGGEGVYGISIADKKIGICIKVLDGNERAVYPIVIHILHKLGILDEVIIGNLEKWNFPLVKDHKGKVVGYTVPIFDVKESDKTYQIGDKYHYGGDINEAIGCSNSPR